MFALAGTSRRCTAVLFDLDDTLVPTTKIDAEAVARASTAAARHLSRPELADHLGSEFRRVLADSPFPPEGSGTSVADWRCGLWAQAMGLEEGTQDAHAFYEEWMSSRLDRFKFPVEVMQMTRRLEEAGYKTGIVTNGHADVQRAKLVACDAKSLFGDRIVVSGEQPEGKPAASIFNTALDMIGARAEEAVMVGDGLKTDVLGGVNAGLLATVWVRDCDAPCDESLPRPTYEVSSVLEIERVLADLG